MDCAFRVDSSIEMGTGHVMRCLTLADALKMQGAESLFICRPKKGDLLEQITKRGHKVATLPKLTKNTCNTTSDLAYAHWLGTDWNIDAQDTQNVLGSKTFDWLIVDHYALDARWEQLLSSNYHKLMVIDDLADRVHSCNMLLDQNLGRKEEDYANLVPAESNVLIGPQFALLRQEFGKARTESLEKRSSSDLKHLLITMGGIDSLNITGQVLEILQDCPLPDNIRITVVMGRQSPCLDSVQRQIAKMKYTTGLLVDVSDMAHLFTNTDLAIGAAGGTAWERCCLGLPSLILVHADNQLAGANALQDAGAAILIHNMQELEEFFMSTKKSDDMSGLLHRLSSAAAQITDGNGAARVTQMLLG